MVLREAYRGREAVFRQGYRGGAGRDAAALRVAAVVVVGFFQLISDAQMPIILYVNTEL